MASAGERLDELAKKELHKLLIRPDIQFDFQSDSPGRGVFCVMGEINGVKFEYYREYKSGIDLRMKNGSDNIRIYSDEDVVESVIINDRQYRNPTAKVCGMPERDSWREPSDLEQEAADAIHLGKKKLDEMREYLNETTPLLMKLITGYFDRSLLPADDRADLRTNAEIFAGFNLKDKKA